MEFVDLATASGELFNRARVERLFEKGHVEATAFGCAFREGRGVSRGDHFSITEYKRIDFIAEFRGEVFFDPLLELRSLNSSRLEDHITTGDEGADFGETQGLEMVTQFTHRWTAPPEVDPS